MTIITKAQYQQLLGLRLLADRHNAAVEEIEKAAIAITGDRENGHTTDWVFGFRTTVEELLALLHITVI